MGNPAEPTDEEQPTAAASTTKQIHICTPGGQQSIYREDQIRVAGAPPEDPGRSFSALHFPRTQWALVHWGDAAMVFVRRGGAHDALIARDEYRSAQPEDWRYLIARCQAGDEALLRGILMDLKRRSERAPASHRVEEQMTAFQALQRR